MKNEPSLLQHSGRYFLAHIWLLGDRGVLQVAPVLEKEMLASMGPLASQSRIPDVSEKRSRWDVEPD